MVNKGSSRRKLTRREQRDLDIEITFIEGVVQRDPHYVEALQVLGDDYTRRGKFSEGLRVDEQLSRLRPRDPMTLYNLACSYSLTNQVEQAIATLLRAVDHGYDDLKSLAKDPDLESVRKHAQFKKILSVLRSAPVKAR